MKKITSLKLLMASLLFGVYASGFSQVIEDGTYAIFSSVNNEAVTAPNQPDFDAQMTSPSDTDPIQQWVFTHQGDDIYQIQNVGTGNYLGIKDNWCGQFGDVQAKFASTDTNINFKLIPGQLPGSYLFTVAFTDCGFGSTNSPVRAFDIEGGAAGGQLQTFDNDPTNANQQFFIIDPSKLGPSGQIIPNGNYAILNENLNQTVTAPNSPDFDAFMTDPDALDDAQIWTFTHQGNDEYQIQNVATGNYLGMKDNWCGQFGDVRASFSASDNNIDFKLVQSDAAGAYNFQVAHTSCGFGSVNSPIRAWDVENGVAGGQIQTFDSASDNVNQQFKTVEPSVLNTPEIKVTMASVFYNPETGLNINFNENLNSPKVQIFDLQGRMTNSFDSSSISQNTVLDVSNLKTGLYLVRILNSDESVQVTKIVVE
ncbi:RICIN domain-containing protein [Nonlabens sp. YIK11]|uniref:T9SS type A sorting domain-containing protein n=1 Tax=Nonlabens sp. YIK11 TaxID=1453349 RepID=UPI0009E689CC|nr:T9SS type A sorting domain-containing protein [Nonlabens sp. YIK11]